MRVLLYAKMLKETETEEIKKTEKKLKQLPSSFFVTFLSLVAFQFKGPLPPPPPPPGYAYVTDHTLLGLNKSARRRVSQLIVNALAK